MNTNPKLVVLRAELKLACSCAMDGPAAILHVATGLRLVTGHGPQRPYLPGAAFLDDLQHK